MKHLLSPSLILKSSHKFVYRLPDKPESIDERADHLKNKPENKKETVKKGLRNLGNSLKKLPKLSPEASKAVGRRLPATLARNISSPKDLQAISQAAKEARKDIEAQIAQQNNPDQKRTQKAKQVPGNKEKMQYSPEALKEALSYFETIEKALAKSIDEIKQKARENPANSELKGTIATLEETQKAIISLHTETKQGIDKLKKHEKDGGVIGTLAQKVAQIAQGEVGKVNSDAEGNAKYSGGKKQAWCADFVNWVLKQAGAKGSGSSMAQSFTGGSGKGHVGIKIGNEVIAGNSRNAVRKESVSKFTQYNTIEAVNAGDLSSKGSASKAPEIAIVTKSRGNSDKSEA